MFVPKMECLCRKWLRRHSIAPVLFRRIQGDERSVADPKRVMENLWRDFFSDPSQWLDHRSEKVNKRYPDFKHRKTKQGLWVDGKLNPPWVAAELSALPLGLVQLDVFSWNTKLARYVKARQYEKTMELFQQMQREAVTPDAFTFVQVLIGCTRLQLIEVGRCIHKQILEVGCESDVYVGSSLIDMYAKCGSIDDAARVFQKMSIRDVVIWNTMILGYVKCDQGQKALELFQQMQHEGVVPVPITFVGVLSACASEAALEEGRRVHEQIIQRGFQSDIFVANTLVDMYAKCGSIENACTVFSNMPVRNMISWNVLLGGHVKCGQGLKALQLFEQMLQEGVEPGPVTFIGALNACASLSALQEGRLIHKQIIQSGCESNQFLDSSLIDMYAKCGSMDDAWEIFSKMLKPDVVSWNIMILGYVKCGQGQKALELFKQMQLRGVGPTMITFVGVLNACASIGAHEEGRCIHEDIIQIGCDTDVFVGSSLVDMYAKCGCIEDAWKVFKKMPARTVVTWNAMILGLVKCGQGQMALELFQNMKQEGVALVPLTFVGVLNACAFICSLEEGRRVHAQIIETGCECDVFVGSSLIDMYAKCGSIEDAWTVFSKMAERDVVSWNAMLGGFVKCGEGQKALELYRQMRQGGVVPVPVTFVGVLNACATTGDLEEGRCIHEEIDRLGCESDVFVAL